MRSPRVRRMIQVYQTDRRARTKRLLPLALILAFATPTLAARAQDRVEFFGIYTDSTSSDGEHETGYTLRLYRFRGEMIGTLSRHAGLIGDAKRSRLEQLGFDSDSGSLSFEARFGGWSYRSTQGESVTGEKVFRFRGSLSNSLVQGKIEKALDPPPANPRGETELVLLPAQEPSRWDKRGFDTYKDWESIFLPSARPSGP